MNSNSRDIESKQISNLINNNIVAVSDDSIILRVAKEGDTKIKKAEHNGFRGGVGLTNDYWKAMYKTDKIIGYWNNKTRQSYKLDQKEEALKAGAVPKYTKKIDLGFDTYFEVFDSYCEAVINDLYLDFKSRYRKGLDNLCKLVSVGIVKYDNKVPVTKDNLTEAMRQRIKRDWLISRYDWNLLILNESIGLELLKRLHPFNEDPSREAGDTVYLSGFNTTKKNEPILIRVYNTKYKTGKNVVKIEIALKRNFLTQKRKNPVTNESYNFRNPTLFLTQPEIQETEEIKQAIIKALRKVFKTANLEKEMSKAMNTTIKDLYTTLTDPKHTLTHLLANEDDKAKDKEIQESINKLIQQRSWRLEAKTIDELSNRALEELNTSMTGSK